MILAAVGCGGAGDAGDTNQTLDTPPPAGDALPAALAGAWNTTLTYVPAYYTGIVHTSDFIGSIGIALTLQANGAYQFDLRSASTYFNGLCFRTTHWSETGAVALAQTAITFTSAHASDIVTDTCGASRYIDPAATGTATYQLTREEDQAGWPRLRLRLPNGEELALERCRDC
jgi:hypothetical protein